ncbi:hypothetical protein ACLB1O_01540 [Escherichia coli]
MTQMGKMSAKLMFASGFRLQFHQAVARGRVTSGRYRHSTVARPR